MTCDTISLFPSTTRLQPSLEAASSPRLLAMAWITLVLIAPIVLVAATALVTGLSLLRNYLAARTIGVSIRFIPISPLNPFWALLDRNVMPIFRSFPYGDNSFIRYNWRGWELEDRYRSHQEMGDMWVLVTPLKNWVYVNDPEALMSIFKRGAEFPRPVFVTGQSLV